MSTFNFTTSTSTFSTSPSNSILSGLQRDSVTGYNWLLASDSGEEISQNSSSPYREGEFLGWSKEAFTENEHVIISEYLLIFMVLLASSTILQYFIGKVLKWHFIPEAAATLILGMAIGVMIRLCGGYDNVNEHVTSERFDANLLGFSPTVFFFGFLPPIIFNSGYHLKRKLFFSNFLGIFSLSIIGTCFSLMTFALGLYSLGLLGLVEDIKSFSFIELVAFGALISSTDPVSTLACFSSLRVDPMLFYLVFGESVLNDAIAITVFKVASRYVGYSMTSHDILACILQICVCFVLSCILGYLLGILTAYLFKFIDFKKNALVSVSIFITTVYIPFLLSETLQLSGIVTILFSGISARRYISKNISVRARNYSSFVFQLLSSLADTACFMLLGMSVFSQSYSSFRLQISVWATLLCYITRAGHVYPLLSLVNQYRKCSTTSTHIKSLISTNTMHMIFLSGLRGAVAFSLAQIFPDKNGNRKIVLSTTTVIILFSVIFTGGLTEKFIDLLQIPRNVDPNQYLIDLEKNIPQDKIIDFEKMYIYAHILKSPTTMRSPLSVISDDIQWDASSGGGTCFIENSPTVKSVSRRESPYPDKDGNFDIEMDKLDMEGHNEEIQDQNFESKYGNFNNEESQAFNPMGSKSLREDGTDVEQQFLTISSVDYLDQHNKSKSLWSYGRN